MRLEGFEPPTRGLEGRRSSAELQAPGTRVSRVPHRGIRSPPVGQGWSGDRPKEARWMAHEVRGKPIAFPATDLVEQADRGARLVEELAEGGHEVQRGAVNAAAS